MSDQTLPTARFAAPVRRETIGRIVVRTLAVAGVILAIALGPTLVANWDAYLAFAGSRPIHWPDFAPIAAASPAIKVHLLAVALALVVGGVLFSGVKGDRLHRTLGWGWSVFMVAAAASSLFIRSANNGGFSFLHLFALATLASVPLAVWSARRHQVGRHANIMTGVYVGGIGVAGLLAFLPGRIMFEVLFG